VYHDKHKALPWVGGPEETQTPKVIKKKKNYYAESITPRHKEEGTGEWDKIRIT
jgi:hypothetical protein